jgi:hypothetical protein
MPRKQTLTEAIGIPMGAAEMPGASSGRAASRELGTPNKEKPRQLFATGF